MDTQVAKTENSKQYNRFREELINCKHDCGRLTTMLGTRQCDFCWEADRKAKMAQ